jgi:hypothetical protein
MLFYPHALAKNRSRVNNLLIFVGNPFPDNERPSVRYSRTAPQHVRRVLPRPLPDKPETQTCAQQETWKAVKKQIADRQDPCERLKVYASIADSARENSQFIPKNYVGITSRVSDISSAGSIFHKKKRPFRLFRILLLLRIADIML